MNLHNIAAGVISAVNPMTNAQWYKSTGNAVAADGTQTPSYAAAVTLIVQQQAMGQKDLQHMAMLNIQGIFTKFYLNGAAYSINRVTQQGGDKFVDTVGRTWLVAAVLELWPDWCAVAATLQVNP